MEIAVALAVSFIAGFGAWLEHLVGVTDWFFIGVSIAGLMLAGLFWLIGRSIQDSKRRIQHLRRQGQWLSQPDPYPIKE